MKNYLSVEAGLQWQENVFCKFFKIFTLMTTFRNFHQKTVKVSISYGNFNLYLFTYRNIFKKHLSPLIKHVQVQRKKPLCTRTRKTSLSYVVSNFGFIVVSSLVTSRNSIYTWGRKKIPNMVLVKQLFYHFAKVKRTLTVTCFLLTFLQAPNYCQSCRIMEYRIHWNKRPLE